MEGELLLYLLWYALLNSHPMDDTVSRVLFATVHSFDICRQDTTARRVFGLASYEGKDGCVYTAERAN